MNYARTEDIQELAHHLSSIKEKLPAASGELYLDSIRQQLSTFVPVVDEVLKTHVILKSLLFASMKIRHSRIVDAHRKTFDWIFSAQALPPSDCRAKIRLYTWLRQDDGIFWISGKPGSGKPTLMKYLDDKDQTQSALLKWAGNTRLVRASFYFWNSGTEMQKSLQGLLQSLLFSVLSECPALVPLACTGRWSGQHPSVSLDQPWGLLELQQAFRVLKQQTFISVCFYFHIDGLDEYSGDHSDVIEILQDLTASASACIKICASSRPWNCFEDAFGEDTDRKLYLQDLTRGAGNSSH